MLIKARVSRKIPKGERIDKSRQTKGERGIWQKLYWERAIRAVERTGQRNVFAPNVSLPNSRRFLLNSARLPL